MLDILGDARDNPAVVTEKILKGRSISHRVSFVNLINFIYIADIKLALVHRSHRTQMSFRQRLSRNTLKLALSYSIIALVVRVRDISESFLFSTDLLESLKAMLLIPRTPTPPPLEARQPSELSHSEIAELQRRIMTKETELVRMKRERTDEASPGPRKRARLDARSPTLELLDDDSFREVKSEELIVPKEEIIDLD